MTWSSTKPWVIQDVRLGDLRPNVVAFSLWKGDIRPNRTPVMDMIAQAVAEAYGISVEDLKGRRIHKGHARPRQHAMYLMAQYSHLSLPMIGRFFDRDHTTVLHGVRAHERRMAESGHIQEAA